MLHSSRDALEEIPAHLRMCWMNNHSLVLVCQAELSQAIHVLRTILLEPAKSSTRGSSTAQLAIKFNLSCCLIRRGDVSGACSLWLSMRKISLSETSQFYQQQLALLRQDSLLQSSPLRRRKKAVQIQTHISSTLDPDQLKMLDRCILTHWIELHDLARVQRTIRLTQDLMQLLDLPVSCTWSHDGKYIKSSAKWMSILINWICPLWKESTH